MVRKLKTADGAFLWQPSMVEGHWTEAPHIDRARPVRSTVTAEERQARLGQKPFTLLFTGLSGSGKGKIARAIERRLFDLGRLATVVDGMNLRAGMSRDLGFSKGERSENLRRGMELAKAMNDAGLITLAVFTAPEATVRARARDLVGNDRFALVHVSTPLEECRRRDPSGLYRDLAAGKVAGVPGVDFEYEAPADSDLTIPLHELGAPDVALRTAVERVMALLEGRGAIVK
jgi:adenylyl-sulfate kinase